MSKVKKENLSKDQPSPVSLDGTRTILFQMENCICKIHKNNGVIGAGFFCEIPSNNNPLKVLITNNHVLNENEISNNKTIDISVINEEKEEFKKIKIDNTRKKFTNTELDITIIEIKPDKDKINSFMEIDDEDTEKNKEVKYKKKTVYILHYPKGKLSVSYGLINDIKDGKINHYCNIEVGSSGSPILSLENNKIIGIHNSDSDNRLNFGIFIKSVIDEFNKNIKINKKDNKNNDKNNNDKNNNDNDEDKYKNEITLIYNYKKVEKIDKEEEDKKAKEEKKRKEKEEEERKIKEEKEKKEKEEKEKKGEKETDEQKKKKEKKAQKEKEKKEKEAEEKKIKEEKEKKEKEEKKTRLFGKKFVVNNKNNIELIIDGNKSKLIGNYKFTKDETIIKIIINNKLTDLEDMFSGCRSLDNIDELKYLNTKEVTNFSGVFCECILLQNIKALEDWEVSKGNKFSYMFSQCQSLKDISPLQKWNVSNSNDFTGMFFKCGEITDLTPLRKWKVSNVINFSYMFSFCSKLSDITPLQKWNVSNGNEFTGIFYKCEKLTNIKAIEDNWKVAKKNFKLMI